MTTAANPPTPFTLPAFTAAGLDMETGFNSLDDAFLLPASALTLVASRPMHGLSTFLLNLTLRLSRRHPDRCFLYITGEETRRKCFARLSSILGNIKTAPEDTTQNLHQIDVRLVSDPEPRLESLEQARRSLEDLMKAQRLGLITIPGSLEALIESLETLKTWAGSLPIGGLLIDSIDEFYPAGSDLKGNDALKAISVCLREQALKMGVAIIAGCPLGVVPSRKQIEIGATGAGTGLERDASLVLAIWNETRLKEEEQNRPSTAELIDFDVIVLKNRRGTCPAEARLRLSRATGTLFDENPPPGGSPLASGKPASPLRRAVFMPALNKDSDFA